jgi:hypothetical protein
MNPALEQGAHETSDAGIRPIVLSGVALAVTVAIVGLVVWGVFEYLASQQIATIIPNPMAAENPASVPQGPRVEEHPFIELRELRSREDQELSTYGWADKKTGAVRIPIDRAMELQLQRGFPVRKGGSK